jgi:hypothetical protein
MRGTYDIAVIDPGAEMKSWRREGIVGRKLDLDLWSEIRESRARQQRTGPERRLQGGHVRQPSIGGKCGLPRRGRPRSRSPVNAIYNCAPESEPVRDEADEARYRVVRGV